MPENITKSKTDNKNEKIIKPKKFSQRVKLDEIF
jgi:hypothetical protein